MVDYLSNIGHKPIKIKEPNYWYKSPLRDEKSPSFKVNQSLNRWYDFGDGKFGNLIDFGILYHKCSVSDFLHKLEGAGHNINQRQTLVNSFNSKDEENNQIKILSVHEISSYPLVRHLQSRKIRGDSPINIAGKFVIKQGKNFIMLWGSRRIPEVTNCVMNISKEAALLKT